MKCSVQFILCTICIASPISFAELQSNCTDNVNFICQNSIPPNAYYYPNLTCPQQQKCVWDGGLSGTITLYSEPAFQGDRKILPLPKTFVDISNHTFNQLFGRELTSFVAKSLSITLKLSGSQLDQAPLSIPLAIRFQSTPPFSTTHPQKTVYAVQPHQFIITKRTTNWELKRYEWDVQYEDAGNDDPLFHFAKQPVPSVSAVKAIDYISTTTPLASRDQMYTYSCNQDPRSMEYGRCQILTPRHSGVVRAYPITTSRRLFIYAHNWTGTVCACQLAPYASACEYGWVYAGNGTYKRTDNNPHVCTTETTRHRWNTELSFPLGSGSFRFICPQCRR